MRHPKPRSLVLTALLLTASVILLGCFTTTLNLGSADAAKVDVMYCGDWHFTWQDKDQSKSADLIVRNFDGKQYYVEWKEAGEKPSRMSGFLVPVKDATFAQLTNLGDKGELSSDHLIVRVQLKADQLTLRHLNDEFFKDVHSDEALKQKIEQNVDNDTMYGESQTGALVSQP